MSVRDMSEEEKKQIQERHREAIRKDREARDAMNGITREKKEEEKED
jgi:hypothetical protein